MPEQAIVETPPTNEESNNEEEPKENYSANEQNGNETVPIESNDSDRNLLRVEVESVSEINDLKPTESQTQGMLLIVESSVDNNKDEEMSDRETDKENILTQMTIVISPKGSPRQGFSEIITRDNSSERSELNISPRNQSRTESVKSSRKGSIKSSRKGSIRSPRNIKSPRKITASGNARSVDSDGMTTKDVVAIYHSDNERLSSVQMELNLSKDVLVNTVSELEQNEDLDYPDDFSADVDNYNSRSEYEHLSPISIPKTSEDENFWDS